jgi:hypothetical protein
MGEIGETVSTPRIGSIPGGHAIDHEQKRNRDELQRTGILPRGIRVNAVSRTRAERLIKDKRHVKSTTFRHHRYRFRRNWAAG